MLFKKKSKDNSRGNQITNFSVIKKRGIHSKKLALGVRSGSISNKDLATYLVD